MTIIKIDIIIISTIKYKHNRYINKYKFINRYTIYK